MISAQVQAALLRALGQAAFMGLATVGASLAANQDLPTLGRNFAVAIISAFIWRSAAEGLYDQSRNEKNEVTAADVGSNLR